MKLHLCLKHYLTFNPKSGGINPGRKSFDGLQKQETTISTIRILIKTRVGMKGAQTVVFS